MATVTLIRIVAGLIALGVFAVVIVAYAKMFSKAGHSG
jgi:hypothetical protein